MKKLIAVLSILVFFALGCSRIGDLIRGAQGGDGSSRPSFSSAGADPKAEVIDASRKFIGLPFFTAKMEGEGQTPLRSEVSYFAPDRYHIKYLGGTGAGMEMIMIGNDTYMKTGEKWTKMPGNGTAMPTLRDSFTEEGLKSLSDVKYEGTDSVDGKSANVYSYKNVTPKGEYPFTSKIWIAQDSGVPMKIVVDYTNGTLKQMRVNYDTETPVTIEPPIK